MRVPCLDMRWLVLVWLLGVRPAAALDTASELERYGRILAHSSADNALLFRRVTKVRSGYRLEFAARRTLAADAPLIRRWPMEFCSEALRQLLAQRRLKSVTGTLQLARRAAPISVTCQQDGA